LEGWQNGRTDTLTKNFINLHKHEGSFQTSLNYGYFINEHQFGWPAPDEAWQARSQTFIGWPACNSKSSFFEFIKNPGSFFQFIENPGSFYRFVENPGSFLWLISRNGDSFLMFTIIVHDADFFDVKIPVFMSTQQHFSWPLFYLSQTTSIWRGLFRKECQLSNSCYKTGILASEWSSQRQLPPCLIPAQHRATILQCPQDICAMVGHS